MMATSEAIKKVCAVVMDLPECPVCMETMTAPVFQCQSGHSLCNSCTKTLTPPACPLCRQPMTQIRNWQLEDILNKVKLPCPNKESGCGYSMVSAIVENHLKECIFREMTCPLGSVFGKCFWQGKIHEIMEHFKERHAECCKASPDTDIVLDNIDISEDNRHFLLVAQGKMLFIITFKLDTLQKLAYFTVQHIGSKVAAKQYLYEIRLTSKRDPRRKAFYSEHCFNDAIKADEVFRLGMFAALPLDYLAHFIKDNKLSFSFTIRWTPTPKAKPKKGDEKNANKPAHQSPTPKESAISEDATPKNLN